jgi:hypothetical protein
LEYNSSAGARQRIMSCKCAKRTRHRTGRASMKNSYNFAREDQECTGNRAFAAILSGSPTFIALQIVQITK